MTPHRASDIASEAPDQGLPARPTWYVGRAGISASLTRGRWLTLLTAGAGAGKTTAIGGWATNRHTAWLGLRADDGALPVFHARFVETVVRARRDRGVASADVLGPPVEVGGDNEYDRADALAGLMADRLDTACADEPTAVILDGFDRLPVTSPAVRFVEALARHTPAGIRLVLASREPVPFAVDRLRDGGHVTEITSDDLAFDVDETYQLLTIVLADAAEADEIAGDLHTLTGGWPGQVSLGAAWLAQQPPAARRDRFASFTGFDGHLAETVFANAEPDRQAFVRMAAHLPRINASLITAITAGTHGPVLTAAAGSHAVPGGIPGGPPAASTVPVTDAMLASCAPMLMPEPGRPGWFRASATARGAVLASRGLDDGQRRDLLRNAVTWYADHDELESALSAALALGEPDVLSTIVETHGGTLTIKGRSADVIAAATAIPERLRTPAVWLVEGEARHSRGDVTGAVACLNHVNVEGKLAPAMARRIGKIQQHTGNLGGAADLYERTEFDGASPVDEAILLSQVATVHWLRDDVANARTTAADAMAMAIACDDPHALAGAYTVAAIVAECDGDFAAHEEFIQRAAAAAERCGDLVQLTRARVNRSQRMTQQGRFVAALAEFDQVLRLIELTGTVGWFGAVTRTNRGWALRGLGRLDEAVADFEAAARSWRAAGSDLVAYAQIGLGSAYLARGDLDAAEAELTSAWLIGERTGDRQALVGDSTLARVRYATDRASAWEIAERGLARDSGNWLNWSLLTMGWLALCDGDTARAAGFANETFAHLDRFPDAAAQTEALELRALTTDDIQRSVDLLDDAKRQWVRLSNAVNVNRIAVLIAHRSGASPVVAEARLRAAGVRPAISRSAGPLRVVGAFRTALAEADAAAFVAAARKARDSVPAHGDMGQTRQMLTDVLALLPSGQVPPQGDVRVEYLALLAALAHVCEIAGDVDAALGWHLRLLENDPSNEDGHLGVVTTLARVGRHEEARRRYRVYTERMRHDSREPAPYPAKV